jgi:hypothetical protein
MSVHRMQFVLVNNMAPRNPSVCAACSRPLDRGYLHDLSTSRRYCGIECYRQSAVVNGFVGSIAPATAFDREDHCESQSDRVDKHTRRRALFDVGKR